MALTNKQGNSVCYHMVLVARLKLKAHLSIFSKVGLNKRNTLPQSPSSLTLHQKNSEAERRQDYPSMKNIHMSVYLYILSIINKSKL